MADEDGRCLGSLLVVSRGCQSPTRPHHHPHPSREWNISYTCIYCVLFARVYDRKRTTKDFCLTVRQQGHKYTGAPDRFSRVRVWLSLRACARARARLVPRRLRHFNSCTCFVLTSCAAFHPIPPLIPISPPPPTFPSPPFPSLPSIPLFSLHLCFDRVYPCPLNNHPLQLPLCRSLHSLSIQAEPQHSQACRPPLQAVVAHLSPSARLRVVLQAEWCSP